MKLKNKINLNKGFLGEVVEHLHPLVESNREALLIQLIVCFGNCLGRQAYFSAAADRHYTNLFIALVGKSSRGRKGQSLNLIKELFRQVDNDWYSKRVKKGLSTGEGLIHHIRDDFRKDNELGVDFQDGIHDKRLLSLESEFSSVLKMTQRDGNILSQVLRDAWDSVDLQTLTKNNPISATNPMVSIIGHITMIELSKLLSSTEIANGLGNRFIFIKAESDKKLPDPEALKTETADLLSHAIKVSIDQARKISKVTFDEAASRYWVQLYNSISHDDASIVGALTARQEAQIRRVAMIIALFNGKQCIDLESLMFAEEIYGYSVDTLRGIYGNSTGDALTDKIYDLIKASPDGLSRANISFGLSKNYQTGNIGRSLEILFAQGLIEHKQIQTAGRPREIWFCKLN